MLRRRAVLLATLLLLGLTGCQLAGAYLATDFSLRVEPAEATASPGDDLELIVRVDRPLGLDVSPLPVTIGLHRAPDGVELADGPTLEVPAGVSEETAILRVGAEVAGGEHEIVLRGSNGVKSRDAELVLAVETAP